MEIRQGCNDGQAENQVKILIDSLNSVKQKKIWILPNIDAGADLIRKTLIENRNSDTLIFKNLSRPVLEPVDNLYNIFLSIYDNMIHMIYMIYLSFYTNMISYHTKDKNAESRLPYTNLHTTNNTCLESIMSARTYAIVLPPVPFSSRTTHSLQPAVMRLPCVFAYETDNRPLGKQPRQCVMLK